MLERIIIKIIHIKKIIIINSFKIEIKYKIHYKQKIIVTKIVLRKNNYITKKKRTSNILFNFDKKISHYYIHYD